MEFNEKLQELRKQKGFTQEELADVLFVSRAAVSKWESGRGYPNIDSLKAIAKFFSISIDELLSGDELLTAVQQDNKKRESRFRDLLFSLFDISIALLLFLPFFAQRIDGAISSVSLLFLTEISPYLRVAYFVFVVSTVAFGVLTLVLQNCENRFWVLHKSKLSLILDVLGAFLFILSLQPYAAIFVFLFLIIKVLMLIKVG